MNSARPSRPHLAHIIVFALVFHLTMVAAGPLAGAQAPPTQGMEGQTVRIVAFGDSLTAGFRLRPGDAFPAKLERALIAKGFKVKVTNAGVSGDTTAAGLERLDWAIPKGTDAVILELGANDALRGIDPTTTRHNLETMIRRITAKGAKILLAGMHAPRNWGKKFAARFDAIFPDLANRHGLVFYPFFLKGVALRPQLNLDDGMHPNARGIDLVVRSILPSVEDLIAQVIAHRQSGRG